ncbi:M56 family metallopeptidase [Streptomyces sp. HNM0574]|nr:M56 family metallopeptidase [Streptomyces sp. HNM0574]
MEALDGLPYRSDLAVLPDSRAYAYALPGPLSFTSLSRFDASHVVSPLVSPFTSRFSGSLLSGPGPYGSGLNPGWPRAEVPGRGRAGRVVVSTGMLRSLAGDERRALIAHERAHLGARHHRFLLASQLAARANPLLRPLRDAVAYSAERWADEEAARAVGDRKVVARAVGKAALVSRGEAMAGVLAFASTGPVPRRVAALLEPTPPSRSWPPALTRAGLAAFVAAAGTAASALSSLNAAVALFLVLKAATPL